MQSPDLTNKLLLLKTPATFVKSLPYIFIGEENNNSFSKLYIEMIRTYVINGMEQIYWYDRYYYKKA